MKYYKSKISGLVFLVLISSVLFCPLSYLKVGPVRDRAPLGDYKLDFLCHFISNGVSISLQKFALSTIFQDSVARRVRTIDIVLTPERFRSEYNTNIFENMVDHVIVTDLAGKIVYINSALIECYGVSKEDLIGETLAKIIGEDKFQEFVTTMEDALSGTPFSKSVEYEVKGNDGAEIWLSANFSTLNDSEDGPIGVIIVSRDITELRDLSMRDPLTGVYNRRYFEEELTRAIARSQRNIHPVSLLMIDVDGLKIINDIHGHIVGDKILKEVARIMGGEIRIVDTLARYGGDEFVVILPEANSEGALMVAERIRKAVEEITIEVTDNVTVNVTVSIGVATHVPTDSTSPIDTDQEKRTLVRNADLASYASKQNGKNRVTVFSEELIKNE